jgi:hypothetical protein
VLLWVCGGRWRCRALPPLAGRRRLREPLCIVCCLGVAAVSFAAESFFQITFFDLRNRFSDNSIPLLTSTPHDLRLSCAAALLFRGGPACAGPARPARRRAGVQRVFGRPAAPTPSPWSV